MMQEKDKGREHPLSARQLEVLRWIAGGMKRKQVAAQLKISAGTVDGHVLGIRSRLGLKGETTGAPGMRLLVEAAIREQLLMPEEVSAYVLEGLPSYFKPVLELAARGATNEEIARVLTMEKTSAEKLVSRLYSSLGVNGILDNGRLRLAVEAARKGLINISEMEIEEGIREGRLVGPSFQCLILLWEGKTFQEIADKTGVEQRVLWWGMLRLSGELGIKTFGNWEEKAIEAAKKRGYLPADTNLPSLTTGNTLTGLEIALLHTYYTRGEHEASRNLEIFAQDSGVKMETLEGVLWKSCRRFEIDPRRPFAYIVVAEKMYHQSRKSRGFYEEVARRYGLV